MPTIVITKRGLEEAASSVAITGKINLSIEYYSLGSRPYMGDEVDHFWDVDKDSRDNTYAIKAMEIPNQAFERSHMSFQAWGNNLLLCSVHLDETMGDWDVGNVGLFLRNGDLFAVFVLDTPFSKRSFASGSPNRKTFNIPLMITPQL